MADTRRNQLKTFVEREFIGPDPIDWEGTKQANGEEILSADAPSTRYIAGILFPRMVSENSALELAQEEIEQLELSEAEKIIDTATEDLPQNAGRKVEYLEDAEELINRSNAYRQSAMSLTVGITKKCLLLIQKQVKRYIDIQERLLIGIIIKKSLNYHLSRMG